MASKMIAIKEDLYRKLAALKEESQSFSDVIEILLQIARKDPLVHFGIGKGENPEDQDDFEKYLLQYRKTRRVGRLEYIKKME